MTPADALTDAARGSARCATCDTACIPMAGYTQPTCLRCDGILDGIAQRAALAPEPGREALAAAARAEDARRYHGVVYEAHRGAAPAAVIDALVDALCPPEPFQWARRRLRGAA